MIKPLVIMVVLVAVVLGGIFGWQAFIGSMHEKFMGAAASAPQTVSTVTATAIDVAVADPSRRLAARRARRRPFRPSLRRGR